MLDLLENYGVLLFAGIMISILVVLLIIMAVKTIADIRSGGGSDDDDLIDMSIRTTTDLTNISIRNMQNIQMNHNNNNLP